ncbi:universal stress protein PHOS34-like [Hibiscus syriacus]|uniref:universal stress protein PHOS34-like n=1 Tax=Hibiscus syriacus TaxID=106335 RepID=UPI001923018D|nr:universal stress protein PHOS34-like [Hibiscus syriacus]
MRAIVGIDESEESFYALQWAVTNLFSAGGEPNMVTLAHVHQPSKRYGVAPSAIPAGVGVTVFPSTAVGDSERKAEEQASASILSQALEICSNKVKAETVIVEGDPKDMLCEISEHMNVDLLIVGSRGLGRIKRAFLGSVSDYCAHHAKCAVLIVKPPTKD